MNKDLQINLGPDAEGVDTPTRAAWRDFFEGVRLVSIWGIWGWQDIRQRYRRSVIGPFWLTISSAIMVGTLGFLYSGLFNQDMSKYLPFFSVGLIIWGFISSVANDSTSVFFASEGIIKQIRLPLTVHVCRMVWRNFIILMHNAIIIVVVMIWAGTHISPSLIYIPFVLFLYCFNGLNIGLFLGIFCTRYRDIVQIVANITMLLFFVTPIMWTPSILSGQGNDRVWIAVFNPVHHFIEIIRAPILAESVPMSSWAVVITTTLFTWLLAFWALIKFRHRVAYWL